MTADFLLIKNVLKSLHKRALAPLGLTTGASGRDAITQKKIFGTGRLLVFSNEDFSEVMKTIKSPEDAGLLIKGVIENEVKEQNVGFLGMLAASLGVTLLGNILACKSSKTWSGTIRAREGRNRSRQDF